MDVKVDPLQQSNLNEIQLNFNVVIQRLAKWLKWSKRMTFQRQRMSQHVTGDPDRLVGVSTHVTLGFFKVIPKTSASCVSAFLDSFFLYLFCALFTAHWSPLAAALWRWPLKFLGKKCCSRARGTHTSLLRRLTWLCEKWMMMAVGQNRQSFKLKLFKENWIF